MVSEFSMREADPRMISDSSRIPGTQQWAAVKTQLKYFFGEVLDEGSKIPLYTVKRCFD